MRLTILCITALISGVLATDAVQAGELLYLPQPFEAARETVPPEGVLVREVRVKKRDNLARIAKRHIGRDDYYPQILLFNRIRNPRLIYPGDLLRVPVSSVKAKTKQVTVVRVDTARAEPAAVAPSVRPQAVAKPAVSLQSVAAEQELYGRAVAAARRGECAAAVQLLDRFMAQYPASGQLSDAALQRADCYLRLAGPAGGQ